MPALFAVFGLGPGEIIVLAIVGVLLFGRKLPETGRLLARGIREFQRGMRETDAPLDESVLDRQPPIGESRRALPPLSPAPEFEGNAQNFGTPPVA
jgi:sec-independent protein translocase protein TatA